MYIVVDHRIHDPVRFWGTVAALEPILPAGVKLHHSIPSPDGRRCVCVWEARSIGAVRDFLEPHIGQVSTNEYFQAQNRDGVEVPSRVPLSAEQVVRAYVDAFNARELGRAAALAAPHAETLDVPTGEVLRGPDGVRESLQRWATAFEDGRIEDVRIVAEEGTVVLEFHGRGTHTGALATPMGEVPATGRPVDLRFCNVLEVEDGKIVRNRLYYDPATMMAQLGIAPALS